MNKYCFEFQRNYFLFKKKFLSNLENKPDSAFHYDRTPRASIYNTSLPLT